MLSGRADEDHGDEDEPWDKAYFRRSILLGYKEKKN